jgi:hypothetical protein
LFIFLSNILYPRGFLSHDFKRTKCSHWIRP